MLLMYILFGASQIHFCYVLIDLFQITIMIKLIIFYISLFFGSVNRAYIQDSIFFIIDL